MGKTKATTDTCIGCGKKWDEVDHKGGNRCVNCYRRNERAKPLDPESIKARARYATAFAQLLKSYEVFAMGPELVKSQLIRAGKDCERLGNYLKSIGIKIDPPPEEEEIKKRERYADKLRDERLEQELAGEEPPEPEPPTSGPKAAKETRESNGNGNATSVPVPIQTQPGGEATNGNGNTICVPVPVPVATTDGTDAVTLPPHYVAGLEEIKKDMGPDPTEQDRKVIAIIEAAMWETVMAGTATASDVGNPAHPSGQSHKSPVPLEEKIRALLQLPANEALKAARKIRSKSRAGRERIAEVIKELEKKVKEQVDEEMRNFQPARPVSDPAKEEVRRASTVAPNHHGQA